MRAEIVVQGQNLDVDSLREWLSHERELRGYIVDAPRQTSDDTMGATADLVVQVAATAAGASAVWVALARSLSVWLTQRRSDVSVTVTSPSGRSVKLDAKRVPDVEALIRQVVDTAPEASES